MGPRGRVRGTAGGRAGGPGRQRGPLAAPGPRPPLPRQRRSFPLSSEGGPGRLRLGFRLGGADPHARRKCGPKRHAEWPLCRPAGSATIGRDCGLSRGWRLGGCRGGNRAVLTRKAPRAGAECVRVLTPGHPRHPTVSFEGPGRQCSLRSCLLAWPSTKSGRDCLTGAGASSEGHSAAAGCNPLESAGGAAGCAPAPSVTLWCLSPCSRLSTGG